MPIRYHAQRKHIIHSLDTLLYQLHTLSFLLAPSLLIYLCRCATQFQFARARELDGRRSLAFWFALVAMVNAGGVWAHAAAGATSDARAVVLDFVGMGHKPSRLQLLLLDVTIMLLQALLTTIAYETSLTLAMPGDIPDPLLPASFSPPPSPDIGSETLPFLPPPSPPPTPSTPNPNTYPPTPALTPPSRAPHTRAPLLPKSSSSGSRASARLPPATPVLDLSARHVAHRLTAPAPEPPERAGDALDGGGGDDELAALRLPLPNTTSVRLAQTLRVLAQARTRRRDRERDEARRPRAGERSGGGGGGEGDGAAGTGGGSGGRRMMGGRIPGAIEEAEDSD
ncbi:hypothetical protein DFH11DRAFT_1780198 [Phellopilus nigrolimitatus]|nr:hypothetical protein DFH11DRAFT_1780198 [Phellopilus nigrolimitatus]